MTASKHQLLIDQFHQDASSGHHGHNMHIFHRDWHQNNTDPRPPEELDENWGTDIKFGSDFLKMHHEMVRLPADQTPKYMHHPSLTTWYKNHQHAQPSEWNPLLTIPPELGYEPDPTVYPDEIRIPIQQHAENQGLTIEQFLTRRTNNPQFQLPKWSTPEGVGPGEDGEPYTGARKLGDFKNLNQLGCCLVFPHNRWHVAIGGAMSTTWTAIADPIFYWGVHMHVDMVFEAYQSLQTLEESVKARDTIRPLSDKNFESIRKADMRASITLRGPELKSNS
tara:strand:+ start:16773 stop:17609 length:837 start_codon:yes stop_codon:yes gene_type:complete